MQNKPLKSFVPPVVFTVYDRFRKKADNPNSLFDGDDSLYKEVVSGVDVYGEYGCGKSTKWMLNNTSAKVIAVDTSEQWIEEVKQDNIANNANLAKESFDKNRFTCSHDGGSKLRLLFVVHNGRLHRPQPKLPFPNRHLPARPNQNAVVTIVAA